MGLYTKVQEMRSGGKGTVWKVHMEWIVPRGAIPSAFMVGLRVQVFSQVINIENGHRCVHLGGVWAPRIFVATTHDKLLPHLTYFCHQILSISMRAML
jgi:hypothetical protein